MENTERQKFEEQWKEAFEGQEMEPSGSVWNNIDLKLDNDKMKRRVIFYQRLAAASMLFALLIGIGGTQYYNRRQNTDLASITTAKSTQVQKTDSSARNKQQQEDHSSESNENADVQNNTASNLRKSKEVVDLKTEDKLAASSHPSASEASIETTAKSRKQTKRTQVEKSTSIDRLQSKRVADASLTSSSRQVQRSATAKPDKTTSESGSADEYGIVTTTTTSQNQTKQTTEFEKEQYADVKQTNKRAIEVTAKADVPLPKTNTSAGYKDGSILSKDNVFYQMTSFFTPELSKKELPMEVMPKEEPRVLPEMPASLMATATQHKKSEENTWLSFGAAAGNYNPGSASSSYTAPASAFMQNSTASLSNQAQQTNTRSSVGSSYSVGLSFGKKVAERWIVQTGVNYMNQAISFTSNYTTYTTSNNRAAFVSDYADKTSAPLAITQPYKVNSTMEFISVPLQAGYLLVDRKFGLQWNAGVATDLFLRNTLKDQSGKSAKYSQGAGADSPYRAFNMAALTSTEISYRMGHQYRVSLVPGVRYSFQSALKSQSGTANNPFILDIGFRFRYIFK